MTKLTVTQARILARMKELAGGGMWKVIGPSPYAVTVVVSRTAETPEANRGNGFGRWPEPTYDRHLFVTLTSQGVIVGDATAPWVGRRDQDAPYWLAELVLNAEDPMAVWDDRLNLKHARRGGVRGDGVRGYRGTGSEARA